MSFFKVIELVCLVFPFNDPVELVFDYGFQPFLFFAEAVDLLVKLLGFLPRG